MQNVLSGKSDAKLDIKSTENKVAMINANGIPTTVYNCKCCRLH